MKDILFARCSDGEMRQAVTMQRREHGESDWYATVSIAGRDIVGRIVWRGDEYRFYTTD